MTKNKTRTGAKAAKRAKIRKANGDGAAQARHADAEHLEVLAERGFEGRHVDLATALNIKPQVLNNWKRRGIAPAMRGTVFKLMKAHRCAPPLDWLTG